MSIEDRVKREIDFHERMFFAEIGVGVRQFPIDQGHGLRWQPGHVRMDACQS